MKALKSLMYHYVRNSEETPFRGIHAMPEKAFIDQVELLKKNFEVASLASAIDFIRGEYQPKKDMCLLTFDDGLKEHCEFVTDVLSSNGVEGIFFIPTASVENGYVLPVHKNHHLLAIMNFNEYSAKFKILLNELYPEYSIVIDDTKVKETYRWDDLNTARFKYLLNYTLTPTQRNNILSLIFEEYLGDEKEFAKDLYLNWEQAVMMQNQGMVLGGHSHKHEVLSHLGNVELRKDLDICRRLLSANTKQQPIWPFSFPFGKKTTYTRKTIEILKDLGFQCAFNSEVEDASVGCEVYEIPRKDPKDIS